jgi:hypothetical protein
LTEIYLHFEMPIRILMTRSRYVLDTCPRSCGLCALRRAKAVARAQPPPAAGGAESSSARDLQSVADRAAESRRQLAAEEAAAAAGAGAAAYPAADGGLGTVGSAAAGYAAGAMMMAGSSMAGSGGGGAIATGATPRLILSVPAVVGGMEAADVTLRFEVSPPSFELGRGETLMSL